MRYLFTVILLIQYIFCNAQIDNNRQLHFNFIGVKDGLPEGTVKALVQDKYGYMWIGTQTGIVRFDGYTAKVYNTRSKAGNSLYVKALYEDRAGRLWMGTIDDGVYLYNRGADSFINYIPPFQKNDKENIYTITAFQDDADGNLWMVTYTSQKNLAFLTSFNAVSKEFKVYGKLEKGNRFINAKSFIDFFEDTNGKLWVGSDNGIYQYDKKQDTFIPHFATTDSSKQLSFWTLMQDKNHPEFIYAGSWYSANEENNIGVWKFNVNTDEHSVLAHDEKNKNSIPGNEVWKITQAPDGNLLICTSNGLSVFDVVHETFANYLPPDNKPGTYYNAIKSIFPDKKDGYWCQAAIGILYFNYATKQFTRYTASNKKNNGLAGDNIHDLLIDKTGNIWFGVDQLGLQWLDVSKSKFTYYENNPNLTDYFPGGSVNSIDQANDSSFWIASDNGLYHWQPNAGTFTLIKSSKDKLVNVSVNYAIADKEGLVWFRAYGNGAEGLYVYDPVTKAIKNYRHNDNDSTSLATNNIRNICEDSSGNIWLGTFGKGISRINKKTRQITNYPFIVNNGLNSDIAIQKRLLDDDEVQSIYTDKDGIVYVGTNNGSINIYDAASNSFKPANRKLFKGFYCVASIFSDSKNRLWAGTYMNGIFYKDGEAYKKFSANSSLLYNGSWGFNEDDHHNLWSLSPRGLTIINLDSSNIRNITTANGLPEDPLYFQLYKTKNGQFLYGTKHGFIQFNPGDFAVDTTKPVVHIEKISFTKPSSNNDSVINVFDKQKIQFSYNENRITFDYVALQYQNTAMLQYAYRLEGYDDEWIDALTDRNVTYTNLSPGTYTFYVKAANSDGVWSAEDDSITIIITPPWWQTWWAYTLYAVLFIVIISAFIAYRSRRLKNENKILEDKVADRTKQLNESLQELKSTQSQLIQSEKMASLGELTAGIAHEIQNPLNFVNNFSEVSNELMDEMNEELDKGDINEAKLIAVDIKQNLGKITHHGKRADAIVKGMLQHSRTSTGQKELTDINALCDEYLRLSYHGLRANDKEFNAAFKTQFDESIGKINIVSQDIGRVLLNLINNAFYAVNEKKKTADENYKPFVFIQTKKIKDKIEIIVSDNGNGIPLSIKEKIFQPFFTTKPTGQGTGLGLSLSYDIVKAHGGEITVESKETEGSEFIIMLPA